MNRKLILAALVASGFTAATATAATSAGDDFLVKIVLTNSCTIVADDLDFGAPANLNADINVDTLVHVTCSGANPVSVDFNAGSGSTTPATRVLTSGANTVTYNIYREPARTTPLGQTLGTDTIDFTSTGGGTPNVLTVYGRVPSQAAKPNGTYQSTVRATVTF